ncbi:hypothetical protein GJR95_39640 [Spirosoma endbachense]|uniref:Uncharacterized protein n=1 Tax=Spirosoma endbachense TaxID=2666025 RepID=A0A6P1W9Q1_9BACT|nr:hypothetical protein [Spirosoma endbachense]QHW00768.1 hypothetical protein GJR95_39640 [Spirosoma endbachense]
MRSLTGKVVKNRHGEPSHRRTVASANRRIGEPSHRRTVASANRRIGEPSHRRTVATNHFALKGRLYLKALQAAFAELAVLKNQLSQHPQMELA